MNLVKVTVEDARMVYEFRRGRDGCWKFRFKQHVAVTWSAWSQDFNSELEARKYAGVEAS